MNYPEKIRARRRKCGVSQSEVGIELGRTQTWVCLLERGLIHVTVEKYETVISAIDRIADRKRAVVLAMQKAAAKAISEFGDPEIVANAGQ